MMLELANDSLIENPLNYKQYMAHTFDKYLLMFNSAFKYETYSCEWYYGIIFYIGEASYDIVCNKYMGNRLIIKLHQYWSQDIPFKESSFGCLPEGIEVLAI